MKHSFFIFFIIFFSVGKLPFFMEARASVYSAVSEEDSLAEDLEAFRGASSPLKRRLIGAEEGAVTSAFRDTPGFRTFQNLLYVVSQKMNYTETSMLMSSIKMATSDAFETWVLEAIELRATDGDTVITRHTRPFARSVRSSHASSARTVDDDQSAWEFLSPSVKTLMTTQLGTTDTTGFITHFLDKMCSVFDGVSLEQVMFNVNKMETETLREHINEAIIVYRKSLDPVQIGALLDPVLETDEDGRTTTVDSRSRVNSREDLDKMSLSPFTSPTRHSRSGLAAPGSDLAAASADVLQTPPRGSRAGALAPAFSPSGTPGVESGAGVRNGVEPLSSLEKGLPHNSDRRAAASTPSPKKVAGNGSSQTSRLLEDVNKAPDQNKKECCCTIS